MKVNIIIDNRFPDKYGKLLEELIRQEITDYKLWDAIVLPDVVKSINYSHKAIVLNAKKTGLKEVCIFEDDCYFPNEKGWQYFLKNKPHDFDVYIGGSYLLDNRYDWVEPLVKVDSWVGNHCIIISEKYYDTFLSLPENEHIDTANTGKGDFYICYPFAALQRRGYSSNNKAIVDYNLMLNDKNIYL